MVLLLGHLFFRTHERRTNWFFFTSFATRYSYWYCMYVIMFAMVIVILNCLTSFYGAYTESTGWLTTSTIFFIIAIFMEFIGRCRLKTNAS